jgi:uncharacterized iron-regulated membrane protein
VTAVPSVRKTGAYRKLKPEVVLIVFLVVVSLIIVVANDWWKRRLVDKVEKKGRKARSDFYDNKTRWGTVVLIALALGAYAYFLNHPELTGRDCGPFTPLVRWLFSRHG